MKCDYCCCDNAGWMTLTSVAWPPLGAHTAAGGRSGQTDSRWSHSWLGPGTSRLQGRGSPESGHRATPGESSGVSIPRLVIIEYKSKRMSGRLFHWIPSQIGSLRPGRCVRSSGSEVFSRKFKFWEISKILEFSLTCALSFVQWIKVKSNIFHFKTYKQAEYL